MPPLYFLGADVGATKTHVAIADSTGRVLGFGRSGPGNPNGVGQAGLLAVLQAGLEQALAQANLKVEQITAAGFGLGGYDWPSSRPTFIATLNQLGLRGPYEFVNDAVLGLLAGAEAGWGVSIVAGTGCNCRGRDQLHQREGRVTGYGLAMGEGAGASELVERTLQMLSKVWSRRRPPSALVELFVRHAGARDFDDFIEGYTEARYQVGAEAAPLILQAAEQGDALAVELLQWAGQELGDMANGVIRQLSFENLEFDVVLIGSLITRQPLLQETVRVAIHTVAPGARLVPLRVPPVLGALVLAVEQSNQPVTLEFRQRVAETLLSV